MTWWQWLIVRILWFPAIGFGCLHEYRSVDGRYPAPGAPVMAHWRCKKCGYETDDWVW
jgi:hypothetical protein